MDFLDARNESDFEETAPGDKGSTWDDLEEVDLTLVPDRVVTLDKEEYTRHEAYHRFAEIAEGQNLMVTKMGETARHYYWECLYCKTEGES